MVVLDTCLIIDHLRQTNSLDTLLRKVLKKEGTDNLAVSVITLQELWQCRSTRSEENSSVMLSILAPLRVFEYNYEIAGIAGRLSRAQKVPIEFADAAIAATCLFNDADFYTLNEKHFKDIPELTLYSL